MECSDEWIECFNSVRQSARHVQLNHRNIPSYICRHSPAFVFGSVKVAECGKTCVHQFSIWEPRVLEETYRFNIRTRNTHTYYYMHANRRKRSEVASHLLRYFVKCMKHFTRLMRAIVCGGVYQKSSFHRKVPSNSKRWYCSTGTTHVYTGVHHIHVL